MNRDNGTLDIDSSRDDWTRNDWATGSIKDVISCTSEKIHEQRRNIRKDIRLKRKNKCMKKRRKTTTVEIGELNSIIKSLSTISVYLNRCINDTKHINSKELMDNIDHIRKITSSASVEIFRASLPNFFSSSGNEKPIFLCIKIFLTLSAKKNYKQIFYNCVWILVNLLYSINEFENNESTNHEKQIIFDDDKKMEKSSILDCVFFILKENIIKNISGKKINDINNIIIWFYENCFSTDNLTNAFLLEEYKNKFLFLMHKCCVNGKIGNLQNFQNCSIAMLNLITHYEKQNFDGFIFNGKELIGNKEIKGICLCIDMITDIHDTEIDVIQNWSSMMSLLSSYDSLLKMISTSDRINTMFKRLNLHSLTNIGSYMPLLNYLNNLAKSEDHDIINIIQESIKRGDIFKVARRYLTSRNDEIKVLILHILGNCNNSIGVASLMFHPNHDILIEIINCLGYTSSKYGSVAITSCYCLSQIIYYSNEEHFKMLYALQIFASIHQFCKKIKSYEMETKRDLLNIISTLLKKNRIITVRQIKNSEVIYNALQYMCNVDGNSTECKIVRCIANKLNDQYFNNIYSSDDDEEEFSFVSTSTPYSDNVLQFGDSKSSNFYSEKESKSNYSQHGDSNNNEEKRMFDEDE